MAMRQISSRPGMPTITETRMVDQAKKQIKEGVEKINNFYSSSWPEFRKIVEETDISLFKDYKPLEF